jgi:hypothetical protein
MRLSMRILTQTRAADVVPSAECRRSDQTPRDSQAHLQDSVLKTCLGVCERDWRRQEAKMSFMRGLLPRPVRRAVHPVRSTAGSIKRRATPRPVRKAFYVAHPLGTATTAAGRSTRRSLTTKKKRRR